MEDLLADGIEAMRRTIREQEPLKPSICLSTMLATDLTAVAKHRHSDADEAGTLLRGDLDWIVGATRLARFTGNWVISRRQVLFYKSFPTSYSYTRLGRVSAPAGACFRCWLRKRDGHV